MLCARAVIGLAEPRLAMNSKFFGKGAEDSPLITTRLQMRTRGLQEFPFLYTTLSCDPRLELRCSRFCEIMH